MKPGGRSIGWQQDYKRGRTYEGQECIMLEHHHLLKLHTKRNLLFTIITMIIVHCTLSKTGKHAYEMKSIDQIHYRCD